LPPTGGIVFKNNFSLHANGVLQIDYESPTLNLTFDGVSFDTLVDVNGSFNGYSFFDLISQVKKAVAVETSVDIDQGIERHSVEGEVQRRTFVVDLKDAVGVQAEVILEYNSTRRRQ